MCKVARTIEKWNPAKALTERWSDWRVEIVSGVRHCLMFIPIARECLVEKDFHDADPEWAHALVYSHLTLHLDDMGGPLTVDQAAEAERLAAFLLDDETGPLAEGDPTLAA
jgi:hypothetical protein